MNTTILALDLGTKTGWALQYLDGSIASGTQDLKPQRFEGGGMRFLRFKRWLNELKLSCSDINVVYFEEVRRHAGVDAAHIYGGLLGHLSAWCEHHNIPYIGVPVGTIKKHATGKGNASKDEIIASVSKRGHEPTDDNEADALAILYWAAETQEAWDEDSHTDLPFRAGPHAARGHRPRSIQAAGLAGAADSRGQRIRRASGLPRT